MKRRRPLPQSRHTPHVCHLCGLPTTPEFEFQTDAGKWTHPSCFSFVAGYGNTPGRPLKLGQRLTTSCGNPICVNPEHLELALEA